MELNNFGSSSEVGSFPRLTVSVCPLYFSLNNQWPELARLIADNPDESSSRSSAVNNNPAIADWFFYERISKFMKTFYVDVLGATDYWFRFEWQHRGSPHVHGVAWLHNAPDIEKLLSSDDSAELLDAAERITAYVDGLVSTMNPGIPADGNNIINSIPLPKIKPHVCNQHCYYFYIIMKKFG